MRIGRTQEVLRWWDGARGLLLFCARRVEAGGTQIVTPATQNGLTDKVHYVQTGFRRMSRNTELSWEHAFAKRFANARFDGTGWKHLYAKLSEASQTGAKGVQPFWVGIELTHPAMSLGYTGVLCVDIKGKVLCPGELQKHTEALEELRNQWPAKGQLRFLKDMDDLRRAARRSIVFGAVVDAASPAVLSLAQSLAKAITIGNVKTSLRVLTLITPLSSRGGHEPAVPLPQTPSAFDVLLQSRTNQSWFAHRDLAVMCGVHRVGLIAVDFTDVCDIFKNYKYADRRWASRHPRPTGTKASGVAHGPNRVPIAMKEALRGVAKSFPLSEISGAIVKVSSDRKLLLVKELETVAGLMRSACQNVDKFVLMDDYRDQGENLSVDIIAVLT